MTSILQPRLFLVILAGGQSTRARRTDSSAPKQFRDVGGQLLFQHSLEELVLSPGVARVVVVVPDPWRPTAEQAVAALDLPCPCDMAPAGAHRTGSTWHALEHLAGLAEPDRPAADDLVAVHDAARPFATQHLLARLTRVAARRGAAVPGVPVPDTIVQLEPRQDPALEERPLAGYLERGLLVAVQTPQVARWGALHEAHAWAAAEKLSFTDDGGLLAQKGLKPVVVMGEAGNWKVTTEEDWLRAAALLRRETSV